MNLLLPYSSRFVSGEITIPGSKSESNRALLLQGLFSEIIIENLATADDTVLLKKALESKDEIIDIHHAGTAMRFLTAYFSIQEGIDIILTGSERMQQRPIGILVEALRSIGASIEYQGKDGYPPLRIKGRKLSPNTVRIQGDVSSQYVSALLLCGASFKKGLTIQLEGNITSIPYIKMTVALLDQIGISILWTTKEEITIKPKDALDHQTTIIVEPDWSAASYYYSIVSLSEGSSLFLPNFKEISLQGDAQLVEIYKQLGVVSRFDGKGLYLMNTGNYKSEISLDLKECPDIAQTIIVTCFGQGIACDLYGLHTLKIKETDRLVALQRELVKLGAKVRITEDSIHLEKRAQDIKREVSIATYNDHRMAMAFAPLCLSTSLVIEDADVVSKSYPTFWEHWKLLGLL